MHKLLLVAGLAAAALTPSLVFAQSVANSSSQTVEVGQHLRSAGIGALISAGMCVAPPRSRRQRQRRHPAPPAGAIVGSQVGRPDRDCTHAYGLL